MKKCYTCQQEKALDQFNKNKAKSDGLNTICRVCSSARSKRYYEENRAKHLQAVSERKKRQIIINRHYVFEYLLKHPCVDCNETDPRCLEFDHQRDKDNNVSSLIGGGYSLETLKHEISKCQVRCANCHSIKTAKDHNYYTHYMFMDPKLDR